MLKDSLPNYLPIAKVRIYGSMYFPTALAVKLNANGPLQDLNSGPYSYDDYSYAMNIDWRVKVNSF